MTDQPPTDPIGETTPETAHALLWRHGLPEDVIDGALALFAQELAGKIRARFDGSIIDDVREQDADLISPENWAHTEPAAPAVSSPPPDQTAGPVCKFDEGCHRVVPCEPGCGAQLPDQTLRDRIASALYEARRPGLGGMSESAAVTYMANSVVRVLLPPVDRSAVLREAEAKAREVVARLWDGGTTQTALDRAGGARAVEFEIGQLAAQAEPRRMAAEAQQEAPGPGADLIEDYVRFLRGQSPEPDLSHLAPKQRDTIAGQFEVVRALADRNPNLPPLDRDPVARRLGLHAAAAEAQQPDTETPAEDPARIDRLRSEFTDHASIESIDAQLRRARAQERRWHIRTEWLISLRQARVDQKARGEWPATAQPAAADTGEETRS